MPENVQQFALQAHVAEWHFVVCVVNEQTALAGEREGVGGGLVTHFIFCDGSRNSRDPLRLRCSRSHR